jgi:hypothetical protein
VELDAVGRTKQVNSGIVYIAHPFADDSSGNAVRVRGIARPLAEEGLLPLAPHIYLPQFLSEATERDLALRLCLRLVALCDELRIRGPEITEGMRLEIAQAERLGIPVVRGEER